MRQRSRARRWSGDADACRRRRGHRRERVGAGRRSRDVGFFDRHADVVARRLFVAIRGDRFDGNAYVADAVGKGAVGAMVSDAALTGAAELAGTPLVVVPDTVAALQTLANQVRRDSGAAVVAVTGSAGKSTTKEITAEFLAARYTVFRNRGNLNNHIGLPLSLLELRKKPDIGVLELGMNHFGEISALVKIAEPEVRVWTNVGPAHLEFFGTVDAIAEAKAEILEGADKDSLLVANADDDLVMRHAGTFAGRVRTFGVERPADVRALAVRDLGIDGTAAHRADADWRSGDSDAAARNGKSVERARRGGGGDPLRCAACRHRRACRRTEAGRPARRSDSRRRRDDRRRLVQLESEGLVARARDARRRDAVCAPGRRGRRDARAGRGIARAASRGRRRSRARRRQRARRRRRGECAGAWPTAHVERGMPASRVHYVENSTAAADLAATLVKIGRCRARQRLARHPHRGCGRSSQGGVCLMLYNLLFQFHTQVPVLNVIQYITFRTAAASLTALVISLLLGPWLIRKLREFQIGQVIRHEGPASHAPKAGTPTMGGLLILTASLVPTLLWADLRNVYIWIAVLSTAGIRCDRIHRRLSEDRPAVSSRPAAALQDSRPGRRCAWCRTDADGDWRTTHSRRSTALG